MNSCSAIENRAIKHNAAYNRNEYGITIKL